MRLRSIISSNAHGGRVNVTPMIDVVMVLIIFYLLVGQLAIDRRTEINPPSTATGIVETQDQDPITLGVHTDGSLTLNGEPIELARLEGEMRGQILRDPTLAVSVRADRAAPFGTVRPVLQAVRGAGVDQVELVTERLP
ncbi:MAG: biopolymer transporter ExbD [Phycisphaerales bacterium]|nr:biopolymer transporter ExbD [Phycisphaerales bacterium]